MLFHFNCLTIIFFYSNFIDVGSSEDVLDVDMNISSESPLSKTPTTSQKSNEKGQKVFKHPMRMIRTDPECIESDDLGISDEIDYGPDPVSRSECSSSTKPTSSGKFVCNQNASSQDSDMPTTQDFQTLEPQLTSTQIAASQ